MKRRDFVKTVPLTALVPAGLAVQTGTALAENAPAAEAPAGKVPAPATSGGSPGFAKYIVTSDMDGTGPDGKPNGQTATFSGASQAGATAESASSKMELTDEEQAILDGKDGEEKAKLMKILVQFGETFGATKLVKLGGAPHSNLYIGAPYMASLIDMLNECADAGLGNLAMFASCERTAQAGSSPE